jgi:hypothetical protein
MIMSQEIFLSAGRLEPVDVSHRPQSDNLTADPLGLQRPHRRISGIKIAGWLNATVPPQVVAVLLVPGDALVVIDQVAAAIQDQPAPVDLDWQRMMRRVPAYQMDSGTDQTLREREVLGRHVVAPVRPPMD